MPSVIIDPSSSGEFADRSAWLLNGLNRDQRLLEFGPSHRPLAPRSQGWQTTIVDHASREGLIAKYDYDDATLRLVEEVDFVIAGHEPLDKQLSGAGHSDFDAVIASHVLEHLPNPIGFFESCSNLLVAKGDIRLALPDKRRCFDFFRSLTSAGEWLEAHQRRDTLHSLQTSFDAVAYAIRTRQGIAWDQTTYDGVEFVHPLSLAKGCIDRASISSEYFDFHAWRFTPASFSLLVLELYHVGSIAFSIAEISSTRGGEFGVRLDRQERLLSEEALQRERLSLLEEMILDSEEQIRAIKASRRYGIGPSASTG